jgi:hypothetical protein
MACDGDDMNRPTGVAILAMLYGVIGVIVVVEGLAVIAISLDLIKHVTPVSGMTGVFGILSIVGGMCLLAFAYGAWKLKPWAWRLGIGIMVVAPILDFLATTGNGISSIVVAGLIIYYLCRPHVLEAFGQ